jgi:UDP-glucose 4-epimerase
MMEKVLITGIAGGQGRLLARRLRENYEVSGVDRATWEGAPRGISVHQVDIRKKKFEDVIRTEMPNAIIHMGFIRHFRTSPRERYDVNVRGTKQLLDHCVHHGVQNLVVISSSYVYGAAPENPYYMDEDAPRRRAARTRRSATWSRSTRSPRPSCGATRTSTPACCAP